MHRQPEVRSSAARLRFREFTEREPESCSHESCASGRRDAEWMAPLYNFLGLSVGVIQHDLPPVQRREAYNSDITYVTNNEVGFDYLRDNMAWQLADIVQRELFFAIVDGVDSILIDEARTPLIISGQGQDATELDATFAKIIPRLVRDEDFTVDEKAHAVPITEKGVAKVEKMRRAESVRSSAISS